MTDCRNIVGYLMRTYKNIRKVVTGRVDDYMTGCLLGYPHLKENY